MNKLTALTVALASFLVCNQPGFANAHHGTNPNLQIGAYAASGNSLNTGEAVAESRNITVNGSRQQVVHLKAQDLTFSEVNIVDSTGVSPVSVVLTAPITFSVRNGNANRVIILVFYTTPSSSFNIASYVTSTSKITAGAVPLILTNLGPGKYAIPVGGNTGIPYGATMTGLIIQQNGNTNNCSNHRTDINEITVNGFPVGIIQGSATFGNSCGGEGTVDAAD